MRSPSVMRGLGAIVVSAPLLLASRSAPASAIICGGSLRDSACNRISTPVPANTPVLFSLNCQGGGSGDTDAGATYSAQPVDVTMLTAKAGDVMLRGKFDGVGRTCADPPQLYPQDGALFRYTGPLQAGQRIEIHYPMTYSSGTPILAFDVLAAADGETRDGCAFAGTKSGSRGTGLVVPLLLLLWSRCVRLRLRAASPARARCGRSEP